MEETTSAAQVAEIRAAASVLIERFNFLRQAGITFGGKRDLYEILGYDRVLSVKDYRDRYARGGLAGRICEAMPHACWRGDMELQEDEDPKVTTAFEKVWSDLQQRLNVNAIFQRADILSQLGYYSVILIGVANNAPLEEELPRGTADQIIYLTPFSGGGGPGARAGGYTVRDSSASSWAAFGDATIMTYETDPTNPRFGQPLTYQLRRIDATNPELQRPVHWSRIIHIAEGCLDNEVYGLPRLERVWNLLDDLDKVTGGGAEAFWLRANAGLQLDIAKDLALPVAKQQTDALKDMADEYQHGIRRILTTRGVTAKNLGSQTADFSNPADAIITQIAGSLAMPKRILTGSEMGELASSQDRDNWKDQINGRQTGYVGPYIVRRLVSRLIDYGYLPTPADGPMAYEVKWPHIQTLTEDEKASGASKWAAINSQAKMTVFTSDEIRDKWYQMEPAKESDLESYKAEGAKSWATTNKMQGTTIFTPTEIRKIWYGFDPLTPEEAVPIGAPEKISVTTPPPDAGDDAGAAGANIPAAGTAQDIATAPKTPAPAGASARELADLLPTLSDNVDKLLEYAADKPPTRSIDAVELELVRVLEDALDAGNDDIVDRMLGSAKSGDRGHKGRKGEVGGSSKGGGGETPSGQTGTTSGDEFISSPGDAYETIANNEKATVIAGDVRAVVKQAAADYIDGVSKVDLTLLTVEGKEIFAGGLGLRRDTMPQIDKEHQKDFFADLKSQGVTVLGANPQKPLMVAPASLLPSQSEINAGRVGKMMEREKGTARPIMISQDDYVLDGHHRWAVEAIIDVEHPKGGITMPVYRIMADHTRALALMNSYMHKKGIAFQALRAASWLERTLAKLSGHTIITVENELPSD